MIFTYHPEGSDEPTSWTVDLGKLRVQEMIAIEKRSGLKYGTEFKQAVMLGGAEARLALLWTLRRRKEHTLKFDDIDFSDEEVKLEMDTAEWEKLRQETVDNKKLSDSAREEQLRIIDLAASDAPEPPGKSQTPTETSETSTD